MVRHYPVLLYYRLVPLVPWLLVDLQHLWLLEPLLNLVVLLLLVDLLHLVHLYFPQVQLVLLPLVVLQHLWLLVLPLNPVGL